MPNRQPTFSKIKSPGIEAGEIVLVRKNRSHYTIISISQLRIFNKRFGKGFISLLKKEKYGIRE
jgi:hypothetical protein